MSGLNRRYQAKGISLKVMGWIISLFAVVISALLIYSSWTITIKEKELNESSHNYIAAETASSDVQLASDYLTEQVRLFIVTGNQEYMDLYFKEAKVEKRREKASEIIHSLTNNSYMHESVHEHIEKALDESNNLMTLEYFAMKLVCLDQDLNCVRYSEVFDIDASAVDPSNRHATAVEYVFGDEYMKGKKIIQENVNLAVKAVNDLMEENVTKSNNNLNQLLLFQTVIIALNIAFMAGLIIYMHVRVVNPMNSAVKSISNNEEIRNKGTLEFNYVAEAYNKIRTQNERVKEELLYEAEHDKLTGLYNRTGYDRIFKSLDLSKVIYILLDIDKFKEYNDTLGHDMGDKVLIRTAHTFKKFFAKDNEYVCRIGGDEFAIIVDQATVEMDEEIISRCKQMDQELAKAEKNVPGTTLSIGVANGTMRDTTDTLVRKADIALYKVKARGKADVTLYK